MQLLETCIEVHGHTTRAKEIMSALCRVLCGLTSFRAFCDIAINEWNIFDAMRKNLPQALSTYYFTFMAISVCFYIVCVLYDTILTIRLVFFLYIQVELENWAYKRKTTRLG